jgi:hypothetical protein
MATWHIGAPSGVRYGGVASTRQRAGATPHTPHTLPPFFLHTLSLSLSILFVLGTWAKEEESSISGRETKEVSSAAANSGVAELSELGKMRGLLEDAKVLTRNNLLAYHRRAQS